MPVSPVSPVLLAHPPASGACLQEIFYSHFHRILVKASWQWWWRQWGWWRRAICLVVSSPPVSSVLVSSSAEKGSVDCPGWAMMMILILGKWLFPILRQFSQELADKLSHHWEDWRVSSYFCNQFQKMKYLSPNQLFGGTSGSYCLYLCNVSIKSCPTVSFKFRVS